MRDFSPGPLLTRNALLASIAHTPRKSRSAAPATVASLHVAPPSVVRRNVPFDPEAQATAALTALTPRKLAVVPLCWGTQVWPCANPAAVSASAEIVSETGGSCFKLELSSFATIWVWKPVAKV